MQRIEGGILCVYHTHPPPAAEAKWSRRITDRPLDAESASSQIEGSIKENKYISRKALPACGPFDIFFFFWRILYRATPLLLLYGDLIGNWIPCRKAPLLYTTEHFNSFRQNCLSPSARSSSIELEGCAEDLCSCCCCRTLKSAGSVN